MLSIGKVIGIINSVFGLSRSGTTTTQSGSLTVTGNAVVSGTLQAGATNVTTLDAQSAATVVSLAVINALIVLGTAVGAVTSATRFVFKKTGIADDSATAILTVTVPNANHAAVIDLDILSSNGGADAFESSRCAKGRVVVARIADGDTVAVAAALTLDQIATTATGATHTLAYSVSAITGASGDPQTFDIQLTINDSGNTGDNQAVVIAECLNSEASGITMQPV